MADRFNLYTTLKNPEKRPLSNAKKRTYHTRVFYVVVILVSVLLQNTPHLFPTIMGCHAWLLLPVMVCVSMFEKNWTSALFAILAGAFWDAAAGWGDGFHALFFLITSTAVCLLMTYLMRNNLRSALILGAAVIVLYIVIYWLIFVVARHEPGAGMLFATFYLPSAAYTFLFMPVYYIIFRKFRRKMMDKYPKKEVFEEEERP